MHLDLSFIASVNDDTLRLVSRNCGETLLSFNVRNCSKITDEGVKAFSIKIWRARKRLEARLHKLLQTIDKSDKEARGKLEKRFMNLTSL